MNHSQDIIDKFCEQFRNLKDTTQKRLVVENDDKANSFSVQQLFNDIYENIHTPITFDYFHHEFHSNGLTTEQAAKMAGETWDCKPLFHYSESKNLNENVNGNARAHSDYAFKKIDDFGMDIDVDLEIKAKELGYFKYLEMI
jgi:UV DNA damage endonuclease